MSAFGFRAEVVPSVPRLPLIAISRHGGPAQDTQAISSEEKIRIVLVGLRGEDSIAELCRQEGIAPESIAPIVKQAIVNGQ